MTFFSSNFTTGDVVQLLKIFCKTGVFSVRGRRRQKTAIAAALVSLVIGAQAQSAAPTLEKIRSEGVINIGVRHSAAPFSYFDAGGQP